jgi:hypothetical protein
VGKKDSINPDMSFAGVMPLHLAVEEGFVDMAAYLIHWKASKTRLDGSKKYPLQYAKARAKSADPKTKADGETMVKCVSRAERKRACKTAWLPDAPWLLRRLLTDDKFLAAYMEELIPRLNEMRVRHRSARKAPDYCACADPFLSSSLSEQAVCGAARALPPPDRVRLPLLLRCAVGAAPGAVVPA